MGFEPIALGDDTPENQARALKLYAAWQKALAAQGQVTKYPPGTFGAYWERLRGTKEKPSAWWTEKGDMTRRDYERAWERIDAWAPGPGKPTLSRTVCTAISTELCEQFAGYLRAERSAHERWLVVKHLKILLADMVVRLRLGYDSPAEKLVNPQPAGRTAIWLGAEVEDLSAGAAIAGFQGMSLAIEAAWETMFSPVDVRTLRPRQMKRDTIGWYFHRNRTKTQAEAFGYISDDLAARLTAYIASQDRAEADDTPIFRSRDIPPGALGGRPRKGGPYKTKDLFARDFRLVREMMFPGDERQLLDIRRSANVEADAAGADKKTMGELLANGLADSKFLDQTYTPPTVTKAREVAQKRLQGREKLAAEVHRLRAAN
jgi:hypothetical protein